jgi:hypothetical protein
MLQTEFSPAPNAFPTAVDMVFPIINDQRQFYQFKKSPGRLGSRHCVVVCLRQSTCAALIKTHLLNSWDILDGNGDAQGFLTRNPCFVEGVSVVCAVTGFRRCEIPV